MSFERHFSAGGVVYRNGDDGSHVLLCGRVNPETWSLPKGTPEEGEAVADTAIREVREETGLEVVIEDDLGEIKYWVSKPGIRVQKPVTFYLMSATGGSLDDHDLEFDCVKWFPARSAADVMTHPTELEIVRKALTRIEQRTIDAAAASGF